MKGPLFTALEAEDFRDQQLNSERIADIETEYTILLQSRGVPDFRNPPNWKRYVFDEMLSLAVLCWFTFPGKKPKYREEVQAFLQGFDGISRSEILQTSFRNGISSRFKQAKAFKDIQLTEFSVVFRINS